MCLHRSGEHMCIGHPGSSKWWGIKQEAGKLMTMGKPAALRHGVGIYSLNTLLCTLGKGRSKNINPNTFRLAQSSVVAISKYLEKSKSRECIYVNTLPCSDNFQPGDFLLWFFYAIIYRIFFFQSTCSMSSWIQYKLSASTVSSVAKEFPTCIVHCIKTLCVS